MTTPMSAYREAAVRWGCVDRNDEEAVTNFFTFRYPNLPENVKQEIMAFLLAEDGKPNEDIPRRRRGSTPPVDIEIAPVEVISIEVAPVEVISIEVAPVEVTPVEVMPSEDPQRRDLEETWRERRRKT